MGDETLIPCKHGRIGTCNAVGMRDGNRRAAPGLLTMLAVCFLAWFQLSAKANVYATDIKLNGLTNNAAVVFGQTVQISYILNEPATEGVAARIYSGTNAVRTFLATPGNPGALAGSNVFAWDCKNQTGSNVTPGVYAIRITAAADGYSTWTNTTDDGPAFQVPQPSAIAVNKNTNSPFYGRVFISSAPAPASGAPLGIFKYNADGSPADEGGFSAGGYTWGAMGSSPAVLYSPWKISISDEDTVYINDWSDAGVVMAFDEVISTNYLDVLRPDNYPYPTPQLSGPFVQGAGTNTQIWMADDTTNGVGIVFWNLGPGGIIASNDTGTEVIPVIKGSDLNWAPYDVALDTNGNIYTIQSVDGADNPSVAPLMRVFCFPPYSGQLETKAIWEVGAFSNSLDLAYGIAVDPTATYVAVAAHGGGIGNGGVSIFYATNGILLTNISQNPNGGGGMECWDVAWDRVGNLYAADAYDAVWRVYSPPGTNESTTAALPVMQVYQAFTPPSLGNPAMGVDPTGVAQILQLTLQGQSNVAYLVEESPDLVNWAVVATNYSTAPDRILTIQAPAQQGFYRAVVAPGF